METLRKPFQGVTNIIRFNWHFYAIAIVLLSLTMYAAKYFEVSFRPLIYLLSALAFVTMLLSLLVSMYIYDISDLYQFKWIQNDKSQSALVNIHAGFDETSALIKDLHKDATLHVFDFYDPQKHTEISIKRARKAYPCFPNTIQVQTDNLPLPDASVDTIFVIFAAHEIRDAQERVRFFQELNRILKQEGTIYVVEHLRDLLNFGAYNIGFLHFHSQQTWYDTFDKAHLKIKTETKLTPFISNFALCKHGTST